MGCYICFPMETDYKQIFYVGIADKEYPPKGQNLKKTGLPLRKLEREFPYLLGDGRRKVRKLQVYFTLLPEYAGKTFFGGKPRNWNPEMVRKFIDDAWEKAAIGRGCTEHIVTTDLGGYEQTLPIELWAVRLYQKRPFDSICILQEQETGKRELEQLAELITPYLPRMKRVVFKGRRSENSERLADYLYEEFGIVMAETENTPAYMPIIDFGAKESWKETLKFLDIAVKNGYNTKVN